MKKILLFGSILFVGSLMAQRTGTNTAKIDFTQYPTVPIEGMEKLGIQIYTADLPFNKDTLRQYLGNMDMMKSDVEQLSKVGFQGINEVSLVGGEGDITIDMAFGSPTIVSKEQKTSSCAGSPEGCTQYYYTIKYRLPALVQARNSVGVLETWELNSLMNLQFGNEQVEQFEKLENGSSTSIHVINYRSETQLTSAFNEIGEASLVRKGIVNHIGNMAESVYEHLFFEETTLKLDIAFGKGNAADYTETEEASLSAVAALENNNYPSLQSSIKIWESWLDRYDSEDKKAAVNDKVAQGFHGNLSIAYTFTEEFSKARDHLDKAVEFSQSGFVNENEVKDLKAFYAFIDKQEKVKKYNSDLNPTEFFIAPDIKKLLGKRKYNEDIDFLIAEDKYAEISKKHNANAPKKDLSEMTVEEFINQDSQEGGANETNDEEVSLEGRVENDMLILSGLVDANMRGKALPSSICEYPEIKTIRARNIGFTSIPDCMNQLTKLEKLYINSNSFEVLPDVFATMKNLEVLDISSNNLKSLPASIYTLTHLEKIYVSGNQLSDADMKKLVESLPNTKFK